MIELKHLCKTFAKPDGSPFTAVQDASLSIHAGEIFGLIGASGAGKSTLLRLINLLERPDSGEVVVDGQTLTALSGTALRRAQQSIGMIFQQFNLLANRHVAGNIAFPLEVAGWKPEAIRQRVQECLEIVGLEDRAAHYPAQLSGGQKQRVGIARALAPHPSVLLADEPTSALDPKTTRGILQFLKEINARLNVTIVIVTHEMDVVRSICHRAAVIDQARILEVTEVANGQLNVHSEAARHLLEDI